MKRILYLMLSIVLCFSVTGCLGQNDKNKLSNEEVIKTFLTAYQNGDYEGIKPYISDDNKLHKMFKALGEDEPAGIEKVYQEIHKQTKNFTYTVEAVEGMEKWGQVIVHLNTVDYNDQINEAMAEAISDYVKNGVETFSDMPSWLIKGLNKTGKPVDTDFTVHVGNRDGIMVMDTSLNDDFFSAVCGGLYDYLKSDLTMTTSSTSDSSFVIQMAAMDDEIIGVVQSSFALIPSDITDEEIQTVIDDYLAAFSEILDKENKDTSSTFTNPFTSETIVIEIPDVSGEGKKSGGIVYNAFAQDGDIITRYGVDLKTASMKTLIQLGLVSNESNSDIIGLNTSIRGFTRDGMDSETEDFGASKYKENSDKEK